jgi:hypothetical protein
MAKWTKANNPHTWSNMAKRRTSTASMVRYVSAPRAAAPIIIRAPRAAPAKHHRKHHRKGGVGGLTQGRMVEFAIGGAAFGFISKNFGAQLPTLPIIGRSGTIALGAYYLGKSKGGIMRDIAIAAAVIAGFEIGTTGKISGDDMSGIAPQVSGLASQV